jgi:hypothetical protein
VGKFLGAFEIKHRVGSLGMKHRTSWSRRVRYGDSRT